MQLPSLSSTKAKPCFDSRFVRTHPRTSISFPTGPFLRAAATLMRWDIDTFLLSVSSARSQAPLGNERIEAPLHEIGARSECIFSDAQSPVSLRLGCNDAVADSAPTGARFDSPGRVSPGYCVLDNAKAPMGQRKSRYKRSAFRTCFKFRPANGLARLRTCETGQ